MKKAYISPAIKIADIIGEQSLMLDANTSPSGPGYDGPNFVKEQRTDEVWDEEVQKSTSDGNGLWDKAW